MWQFANSKLKKKVGYKKLSNFLKDLGLKQRTVFNEKDETHQLRHPCFWLAESPEDSQLYDKQMYRKYKTSQGAWLHMNEADFTNFNLTESMMDFEAQMEPNFNSWNMEFKSTSVMD